MLDRFMGKLVRDKITGFTGIVNAKCEYITGCVHYSVLPQIDSVKNNIYPDYVFIDWQRLEIIGDGIDIGSLCGEDKVSK